MPVLLAHVFVCGSNKHTLPRQWRPHWQSAPPPLPSKSSIARGGDGSSALPSASQAYNSTASRNLHQAARSSSSSERRAHRNSGPLQISQSTRVERSRLTKCRHSCPAATLIGYPNVDSLSHCAAPHFQVSAGITITGARERVRYCTRTQPPPVDTRVQHHWRSYRARGP